jgi:PAS domain S-box-containing protein
MSGKTEPPTYAELQQRVEELLKERDEHVRAVEALRHSRLVLEGIFHAIPVRVFWKDLNLVYVGCNEAFAQDAGLAAPSDIAGKDDFQMVWREQAELYRDDDRRVIESGTARLLIEEPQTTPEGNTITLLTSKLPLRDAGGAIIGVLGTYMDITHRKMVEEELERERLRLYDALADVDVLRGILPICARCKKIRDDTGYWSQVEQYVSEHSRAEFTHSLCPPCAKILYPELTDDELEGLSRPADRDR